MHKTDLKGLCPAKGDQVQLTVGQTEKGPAAKNVKIISPEKASYYGHIQSYNHSRGFGFISSEAFPQQDVFLFWPQLRGGFGPEGSPCKFIFAMVTKVLPPRK